MVCFVDSSVFVRFLTKDDPVKAKDCALLFQKAQKRKIRLLTSEVVIAEIAWVLNSWYRYKRELITEALLAVLNAPYIEIPQRKSLFRAVMLYAEKKIDLVDAFGAVFMEKKKIKKIYSYDRDFDKLTEIQRLEP